MRLFELFLNIKLKNLKKFKEKWTHSCHTEHVLLYQFKQLVGVKTKVFKEIKKFQEVCPDS